MGLGFLWKVLLMPNPNSLVLGYSVHFSILHFFFKFRSSPNFHPIHPIFIQCIIIIQAVTFFGDRAKIAKIMAFWEYSLSRTICCSHNFQSAISRTIFIGLHPNFMTTLVTMVNLNAY